MKELAVPRNVVSCMQPGGQRNEFELIPMVQMESQHSIGAATSRDFPRFVIILQISRPEVGSHSRWYQKSVKSCVIYRTKKPKKKSARSVALSSVRLAPKICQGQRQTMYSHCPKFHPNRFTSSGVIAERVNTVQTHHKVFPILGEASFWAE